MYRIACLYKHYYCCTCNLLPEHITSTFPNSNTPNSVWKFPLFHLYIAMYLCGKAVTCFLSVLPAAAHIRNSAILLSENLFNTRQLTLFTHANFYQTFMYSNLNSPNCRQTEKLFLPSSPFSTTISGRVLSTKKLLLPLSLSHFQYSILISTCFSSTSYKCRCAYIYSFFRKPIQPPYTKSPTHFFSSPQPIHSEGREIQTDLQTPPEWSIPAWLFSVYKISRVYMNHTSRLV